MTKSKVWKALIIVSAIEFNLALNLKTLYIFRKSKIKLNGRDDDQGQFGTIIGLSI